MPIILQVLRSGVLYFLLVFAIGFALGTIRTMWIAPSFGAFLSVLIELPVMILCSWWACGFVQRRWPVSAETAPRLAMGLLAFGLLLAAEALVSVFLGGLALSEHVRLYATAPVLAGLFGQVLFALFPLLRLR